MREKVTPNDGVSVEKVLPNGDLYTGSFSGQAPHGSGKYLWKDGCMYEGEWKKGKASGKGKFCWPSGASYEGEFKGGRMEGFGLFIGPEGDSYRGFWSGDKRHGFGERRYGNGDWYEGEWKRGLHEGKGRYVWRNGDEYFGEWKSGGIFGKGVLVWGNGDWFEGDWVNGVPRNGVFGCGDWGRNWRELSGGGGKSRVWKGDGGVDLGRNWRELNGGGRKRWSVDGGKNGVLRGEGVIGLGEGMGNWKELMGGGRKRWSVDGGKNGVLSGEGVIGWGEGVGNWKELRGGGRKRWSVDGGKNGVLRGEGVIGWGKGGGNWKDLVGGGRKRWSVDGGKNGVLRGEGVIGWGEGGANWKELGGGGRKRWSVDGGRCGFPRMCIWESDGEDGDITCEIVDGVGEFRMGGCWFSGGGGGEGKKFGEMILKGHKNYELMLNLQLGIRYSVGKHAQIQRDLKPSDFDPKEKFWTRFPPEGSKTTPPHQSAEFWWKDYCPMVFRRLRELFQVDTADYMLAICGNDALREFSSPGKSGSFFYLTQDDRFMIKTVKKSEVKVLIRMLPSYYKHVCRYENSLVTKFFGVHCVKPAGGLKTRFIVMGNLFCSEYRIHRRFDLKGSSHGRMTDKPEDEIDETTTLKDLDLNFVFRLQGNWYQELIKQIDRDCEFLEAERIMDYSLLVGLHFHGDNTYDNLGPSPFLIVSGNKDSYQNEKFVHGCRFLEVELPDKNPILAGGKTLVRLGANMPARAERVACSRDFDQYIPRRINHLTPSPICETYEVVLYFGIIDILQDYDISKKLEHAYKSLQADPSSISAVDPKLYSKRFRDFIGRIFMEDR